MTSKLRQFIAFKIFCGRPALLCYAAAATLSLTATGLAQTPSPSPAGEDDDRYSVTASTEIGGRWLDVNGNENKYRSDLNYRQGFRLFDSSVLIEDKGKTGFKAFDSALFLASGWGADPSGYLRANLERSGAYRFDANVRRVSYFNFLNNHAIGNDRRNLHNANRQRNFGDFDLTVLPENPNFRFRVGYSYNIANGSGSTSTRISRGDVFPLFMDLDTKAHDFRVGADGKLFGFNLSGTYGYRNYKDRTFYSLTNDPGDVPTNTNRIITLERRTPVDGETHFGVFSVQRTFAKRFDFTAKVTHAVASTDSRLIESLSYINTTNVLVNETYDVTGDAKRPQTRADLGMTWRITDNFRLSNTFTYDGYNVNGGNIYVNLPIPGNASNNYNYYTTRYRRYMNLLDADYQFSNRVGVNLGWRYTNREVSLMRIERSIGQPLGTAEPEDAENTTHSVIAGGRFKPTKNWSIYADIEGGKADNVFTRLANYEFFNFRIRSRANFNKFAVNASFITKDNDNPGQSVTNPDTPFVTEMRARIFSTSVDWDPISEFRLSAGYDHTSYTSEVSVLIPLGGPATPGLSQYFVRDNYFFIDAHARPIKRVALYGSYRWNRDRGHGDRLIPAISAPLILSSYPIDFKTPEFRASVRLNRYLDWNFGYQYYDYNEETPQQIQYGIPFQNYRAHLPYMSLRIYLGGDKGSRW